MRAEQVEVCLRGCRGGVKGSGSVGHPFHTEASRITEAGPSGCCDPPKDISDGQLAATALPTGSFQHLDVSPDGRRLLFAFCRAETAPKDRTEYLDRFYHLYEVAADGTNLRQLTDGPFDDFAPRYLPNGKIAFVSTRRGGFHRCGRGPCPVYTLALAESDGSNVRTISFHETHEWDPAVLNDGRLDAGGRLARLS